MALADLHGRVVVLNLWATWCRPCIEELPSLQRLDLMMRSKGVAVVAVSVDAVKELEKVETFLNDHEIGDVARYHDIHGNLQNTLKTSALPSTYILDANGRIMYEIAGKGEWDDPQIVNFLLKLGQKYVD